jgi:CheY-like chemotaxis protein
MSKGSDRKTVLILDDEPEYLSWVEDFLESKGLQVKYCTRLADGLRELAMRDYRLFLVDMNVPSVDDVDVVLREQHPLCQKYPGLALVFEARNLGFGAHSVIAYTVHDDELIDAELAKLHVRYVLKGRPEALKKVITASLAPAPVGARGRVNVVPPPTGGKIRPKR